MASYPTMPVLLKDSHFRQFRVRLKNDRFVKLRRIYSAEQLKKELDRLMPEDCYQTISCWSSPQKLGVKRMLKPHYPLPKNELYKVPLYKTDKILNNNLLKVDYLMDFDAKDYKSLEDMQNNLKLARLFLQQQGMKEHLVMKTPSGGRQLLVMDFDKWAEIHEDWPSEREKAYLKEMRKLTSMMQIEGIRWDWKVSLDTRRVCRVPDTVRLSTGKKVRLIEFDERNIIRGKNGK